ncbi:hypothetical protein EYF80_065093 [Liparis tanakae]|uniref:Uncharacterized protein n=1 Tax=Liparis tanakae TaxID=230148 RepID=A0A4Z2E880_9TELE|nr:hypothetical protein EYF80_065093 [Liparis tanakae]
MTRCLLCVLLLSSAADQTDWSSTAPPDGSIPKIPSSAGPQGRDLVLYLDPSSPQQAELNLKISSY